MNTAEHVWVRRCYLIIEIRNNLAVLYPFYIKCIGESVSQIASITCIFKSKLRYVNGVVECNKYLLIITKQVRSPLTIQLIAISEQIHVPVIVVLGRTDNNLLPFIGLLIKAPYLKTPLIIQAVLKPVCCIIHLNLGSRDVCLSLSLIGQIGQVSLVTKVNTHLVPVILGTCNG